AIVSGRWWFHPFAVQKGGDAAKLRLGGSAVPGVLGEARRLGLSHVFAAFHCPPDQPSIDQTPSGGSSMLSLPQGRMLRAIMVAVAVLALSLTSLTAFAQAAPQSTPTQAGQPAHAEQAAQSAQAEHQAGEANLVLPDLSSQSFMGMDG